MLAAGPGCTRVRPPAVRRGTGGADQSQPPFPAHAAHGRGDPRRSSAGSAVFWLRGGRYASTDDAYVQDAKLLVTTDVSGVVATVNVHEGQAVKAGDLLFQLDLLPFQIALDSANGQSARNRADD